MPTIWNTANIAKTVNRNIAIGLTNLARSPWMKRRVSSPLEGQQRQGVPKLAVKMQHAGMMSWPIAERLRWTMTLLAALAAIMAGDHSPRN